jgi:hypothetical protein
VLPGTENISDALRKNLHTPSFDKLGSIMGVCGGDWPTTYYTTNWWRFCFFSSLLSSLQVTGGHLYVRRCPEPLIPGFVASGLLLVCASGLHNFGSTAFGLYSSNPPRIGGGGGIVGPLGASLVRATRCLAYKTHNLINPNFLVLKRLGCIRPTSGTCCFQSGRSDGPEVCGLRPAACLLFASIRVAG